AIDREGFRHFTGEHDASAQCRAIDHVRFLERFERHDVAFDLVQLRRTHFSSRAADARIEAEFRQALLQRHLAAFETRANVTALAGALAFVTAGRGFAEAATDTTANALDRVLGT